MKLVGVYECDSRSYTVGFSPTEGVYTDPQEFAAKLNWEGRKIYWGFNPPTPRQFQP